MVRKTEGSTVWFSVGYRALGFQGFGSHGSRAGGFHGFKSFQGSRFRIYRFRGWGSGLGSAETFQNP